MEDARHCSVLYLCKYFVELSIAEGKGGKERQTKVKGGQRRLTGGGIRKAGKSRAKLGGVKGRGIVGKGNCGKGDLRGDEGRKAR